MTKVAVVGLGKLGLAVAVSFANAGNYVYGIDHNEDLLYDIREGTDPHNEPYLEGALQLALDGGKFALTTDYAVVKDCDFSIIIVPTPSGDDGRFLNTYVVTAISQIAAYAKSGHIVVVSSTVMPGSCEQVFVPIAQPKSLGLVYSPEFIALGSVVYDFIHPDMVLIGGERKYAKAYEKLIRTVVGDKVPVHAMSLTEAEITKLSLNTYLNFKIAFANTIARLALPYDADPKKITKAIGADTRVGKKFFSPGLPPGGTCLPRDLEAFISFGGGDPVSDLAKSIRKVNSVTQFDVVEQIAEHVKDGQTIGVLGLSYKTGTPVTEKAFGYWLADAYSELGYTVNCYDPKAVAPPRTIQRATAAECVNNSDVVVICTQEAEFASVDLHDKTTIDIWGVREDSPSIFCPFKPV